MVTKWAMDTYSKSSRKWLPAPRVVESVGQTLPFTQSMPNDIQENYVLAYVKIILALTWDSQSISFVVGGRDKSVNKNRSSQTSEMTSPTPHVSPRHWATMYISVTAPTRDTFQAKNIPYVNAEYF